MSKSSEVVGISEDERFPTYRLTKPYPPYDPPIEVSIATLERWRSAIAAYDAVQEEMGALYDEGRERAQHEAAVEKAAQAVADAQAKLDALRSDA